LYKNQGRYAEAEPLYRHGLAIREKAPGPEHPDVGNSLTNLGLLYLAQNRYAEAEPLYKRGLAIREKTLGSEHPDVATSLTNLAALNHAQAPGPKCLAHAPQRIRLGHLGPAKIAIFSYALLACCTDFSDALLAARPSQPHSRRSPRDVLTGPAMLICTAE
jgi:tetratricopeptide (TPR) repeat protein